MKTFLSKNRALRNGTLSAGRTVTVVGRRLSNVDWPRVTNLPACLERCLKNATLCCVPFPTSVRNHSRINHVNTSNEKVVGPKSGSVLVV